MFKQNFYNIFFSYLGLALGFYNTIFRAKILEVEYIGLIATILSVSLIMQHFCLFGLPTIIIKYYNEIETEAQKNGFKIFSIIWAGLLFFIISIFLFIFKPFLLKNFNNDLFTDYFYFTIIFLFINTFIVVLERLSFVMYKSVISNFYYNFILKIFHLLLLFLLLFLKLDFKIYFSLFTGLNIAIILALFYLIFKDIFKHKIDFSFLSLPKMKQYLNYGIFMFLSAVSANIILQIDKIMISHYLDFSYTGIYAIAITISGSMGLITIALNRIAQPDIAKAFQTDNIKGIQRIYKNNLDTQLYLGIYLFLMISFFSKNILNFIGKEYSEGQIVMILIALAQLFNIFAGICGEIIALSKQYKFDFISRIILVIIVFVFNMIFIPHFGIKGAAMATCLNYIVYDLIKGGYAYKKFQIQPFSKDILKYIFSGLLLVLFYFLSILIYESQSIIYVLILSSILFVIYEIILTFIFKYKNCLTARIILPLLKKIFF